MFSKVLAWTNVNPNQRNMNPRYVPPVVARPVATNDTPSQPRDATAAPSGANGIALTTSQPPLLLSCGSLESPIPSSDPNLSPMPLETTSTAAFSLAPARALTEAPKMSSATPQGNLQMGRILAAFVICVLCLATSASSKAVLRFIAGEHKRLSNGVRIWLQYHRFCFHFGSPFIARQCDIVPFFQIQLKLNASDPGSLAAERHLHMPNGLALTYGAIVALAGDHYGVPERPISDGTTQVCLSNTVCVLLKAVFPHHVHSLLPHLRLTN